MAVGSASSSCALPSTQEPVASTKFILHTRDMHRLYAKLGFAPPDARLMERWPGT